MAGRTILVLEDEAIISMDIESTLQSMGYDVICAPALADAIEHAGRVDLVFALLDYIIDDHHGTSAPVAEILRSRGIPFGICSGTEPALDGDLVGVPVLGKPFTSADLEAFMRTQMAGLPSDGR